jgi:hypothetical protein
MTTALVLWAFIPVLDETTGKGFWNNANKTNGGLKPL